MAYTKLFNTIITSTIWSESHATRIVWVTLMAMADQNGEVLATVPGLARMAAVTVDECRDAINLFMSPDPYSRSQDDEGRRLEVIEGGWALLNYKKYREMANDDDRKAKASARTARYRAKLKRNGRDDVSMPPSPQIPHTEAEADPKADSNSNTHSNSNTEAAPVSASVLQQSSSVVSDFKEDEKPPF